MAARRPAPAARPASPAPRAHRWAVGRLAHPLAERTVEAWRSAPAARRRWLLVAAAGLALCVAASAGLALWGRRLADAGALAWEADVLRRLDAGLLPLSYHSGVWLGAFGSTAMLVPLAFTAAMLLVLHRRVLAGFAVLAAYFGAKPIVLLGWELWARPRPDFIEGGVAVPLSLHAFPSGHAVQTVAVYGFLTWLWTRASRSTVERVLAWALLLAFVAITMAGRLRIGAHWPTDVAAGVLLGAAWAAALAVALRGAEARGGQ